MGVLVICVLVFTVFLYCFAYVYLFLFVTSVRTTAPEWKLLQEIIIIIIIFLLSRSPCRLWGPHNLLLNGYRDLSRRQSGRDVKLTTHVHLVPRLRISGAKPQFHSISVPYMGLNGTC